MRTLRRYLRNQVLILVLMEDGLRLKKHLTMGKVKTVLILVLMEDGLRHSSFPAKRQTRSVLILVLMEDGLRPRLIHCQSDYSWVLILVLMEDGLRLAELNNNITYFKSLNPCFNGRWSPSMKSKGSNKSKRKS